MMAHIFHWISTHPFDMTVISILIQIFFSSPNRQPGREQVKIVKITVKEIKVPESLEEFLSLTEKEKLDAIAYDDTQRAKA